MMTVPLGGKKAAGRLAMVDDADYGLVMQYRWCTWRNTLESRRNPVRRPSGPYAVSRLGGGPIVRMHTLLTGWPRVDHIDHDGLNNQRSNLRPVSHPLNLANQRAQEGCTSPFKGVCLDKRDGRWYTHITVDGKTRYLGRFTDEIAAAHAYDKAALAAWGEFAHLNFPLAG